MDNKKKYLVYGSVILIILVLIGFIFWLNSQKFEKTDNAYVHGNQVVLNAQIAGTVTKIGAEETYLVQKGQLLVSLDPTDKQIEYNLKLEQLAGAYRHVVALFENYYEKQVELERQKIITLNSERDFQHRQELLPEGAVSLEEFQNAETQLLKDDLHLVSLEHQLASAWAQIENTTVLTHPKVLEAIASLKQAFIDLKRCEVLSPVDGIVAQRRVQVGERVTEQTPLMAVIPTSEMWVEANFREIQLKKMRIGQSVELYSDLYGSDVQYKGTISGIGIGTGSVFSILPPQNATGNWIKIVQRVPVRIDLDSTVLKKYPLRLGLSMAVKANVLDQEGPRLPLLRPESILYETDIYQNQDDGFDEVIEEIVLQNVPKSYRN